MVAWNPIKIIALLLLTDDELILVSLVLKNPKVKDSATLNYHKGRKIVPLVMFIKRDV